MPKELTVTLSDIEYGILNNLRVVDGKDGEKLRNLLRLYISTTSELKSAEYALKRQENKKEIDEILKGVWAAYEHTEHPTKDWSDEKINKLTGILLEINALMKIEEKQYIPSNKFRGLFKTLLNNIASEDMELDVYSAACIATIQLLMEFGVGILDKETIRDGTIFINEGWMFIYSTAMKRAREFMKTKKLFPDDGKPDMVTPLLKTS
jgi:hypothetical protein